MMQSLAVFALSGLVAGCGFHLRSTGDLKLPESLASAHVDARLLDSRLQNMMLDAWESAGGRQAEPDSDSPRLILFKEKIDREILSVSSADAKVSEYLLRYRLGFRMLDKNRQILAQDRYIKLRRSYTFDANSVLAKEREQEWLLEQLRLEAVRRIVHEVARLETTKRETDMPEAGQEVREEL